jgi:hypothetical protein
MPAVPRRKREGDCEERRPVFAVSVFDVSFFFTSRTPNASVSHLALEVDWSFVQNKDRHQDLNCDQMRMARQGRAIGACELCLIKRFASERDPLLLFRFGGGGGFVGVLLLEALDATGCVDQLLLAGEEWVALRADFDADQLAFAGGAGLKRASAGAVDRDGMIIGVNSFFH